METGKIYIVGKDRCKLQPIDVWQEYIKIKNKKKIRFVVVVYVLQYDLDSVWKIKFTINRIEGTLH